jgi:hypothetical protein
MSSASPLAAVETAENESAELDFKASFDVEAYATVAQR